MQSSIIIPVFNNLSMTSDCIAAVLENTHDYEIIVVDNGSDPVFPSPFPLEKEGITQFRCGEGMMTVIRNETNLGFPVAVNQGIKAAKGEVIVLLNNDVTVSQGWAPRLLAHLDTYSIVGPVTNFSAGMQSVTIPVYQDERELNLRANEWAEEHRGESQEVNWIIGFCMAFKKSLWEELDGFDESFWPCCGEEVDFCKKAQVLGHKIGIVQDVYIHHFGNQTFNEMQIAGQLNYQDTCYRNDRHLESKWGKEVFVQSIEKTACEDVPGSTIKINLGCGLRKIEGFINIDNRPEVSPDLICDVVSGLPYPDNSVAEVRAYDFLEHIPIGKTVAVITEIWRVLKPGGRFESFTPSTDGRGAFQDPTHCSFWNKNSWLYYSDPAYRNLYRMVPNFEIERIEDTVPDPQWKIIHTHVIAKARKEAV